MHIDYQEEGIKNKLSKSFKMFLAVTLHNIPEGLAVGVVVSSMLSGNTNQHAMYALAIGIAIQNFPEGTIISMPLKENGYSKLKAFLYGFFSGIVEPIAAVIGLFLAMQIQGIMPWALAFAAGCMIYVVAEEMIPEMTSEGHDHYGVWSFILGFVIMMALDCLQF